MTAADPYTILGIGPTATAEEAHAAWRRLVTRYHPDRFAGQPDDDRMRAEEHVTIINAAYQELISGRARTPNAATSPAADDAGAGAPQSGFDWSTDGQSWDGDQTAYDPGWFDQDTVDAALGRIGHRRRQATSRRVMITLAVVAGLATVAGLAHLSLSRTYTYDYVFDGRGTTYTDVDCGDGYDRGRSSAAQLRARYETSRDPALLAEADTVEAVCGKWTRDLYLLWVPLTLVGILGFWYVLIRRR